MTIFYSTTTNCFSSFLPPPKHRQSHARTFLKTLSFCWKRPKNSDYPRKVIRIRQNCYTSASSSSKKKDSSTYLNTQPSSTSTQYGARKKSCAILSLKNCKTAEKKESTLKVFTSGHRKRSTGSTRKSFSSKFWTNFSKWAWSSRSQNSPTP